MDLHPIYNTIGLNFDSNSYIPIVMKTAVSFFLRKSTTAVKPRLEDFHASPSDMISRGAISSRIASPKSFYTLLLSSPQHPPDSIQSHL